MKSLNFFWVCFDPSLRHYEAEKFTKGDAECTLAGVKFHLKVPQHGERLFEIGDVMLDSFTFDKHIVHIHHVSTDLLFEDLVDEPLIGRTCIF